mgnify:CR=1 FL=1
MTEQSLKVLNRDVMKALIGDDMEMIKKFEIDFLKQAKESIAKLANAYKSDAYEELKEEAHFLKTSAKAIGAEQLAEQLEQLEHTALANDKQDCKKRIMAINNSIKQVYGAIVNES